ncbi:restriction endonuclease subunit S, partial [Marinomonas pontica]|uniref:restriction endonuclease subunit S n=1 Tax=Marinomonas pontica TaxID=264739 RepID=UPI002244D710|nr:restriction endonuclease subunit S [Marinomonas pontica]
MAELHSLQKDFSQEGNVQQLITQHIDLWTGAVKAKSSAGRGSRGKRELYGIKKLRELILELAVRGKLVAQDPNDEPASVLLKRIAAEKEELVKQGKIKKPKKLPEISEEEKPFELPVGWEWANFQDIAYYLTGKTPATKEPSYWEGKFPWVSIADLVHGGIVQSTSKLVSQKAVEKVFKYAPIKAGTLLMSFKLTVGKVSVLGVDGFHNEAIISIYPFNGILQDYLLRILPSRA